VARLDRRKIAGGVVLLMSAIRVLTSFHLAEPATVAGPAPAPPLNLRWMGGPVLSPLAIPSIVTPVGIVVVLYFSGLAIGKSALQGQLVGLLIAIMSLNLLAMLCAAPIMRVVGLPVLQVIGWVFSALQAGLAVEVLIDAVRRLAVAFCLVLALVCSATAQELDPRAFAPTPIGTTIVLAGIGESTGGILFDPSVGVDDVNADLPIVTTGVGYTFGLAGRQARMLAVFPIAWGNSSSSDSPRGLRALGRMRAIR
jgi:small neutral amino acid transporter SnatA (MarC family)